MSIRITLLVGLAVMFPTVVTAGSDPILIPCARLPDTKNYTFPPPIVTTVQWNNYSVGMICGMQPVDPLDSMFVAWAGNAFSMGGGDREYAYRSLLVSTAAGTSPTWGAWRQAWPVQEGINLGEGGFDAGCYSSSAVGNYSALFYSVVCSEDGPCGCIASYPLEASSKRAKPIVNVTTSYAAVEAVSVTP